MLALFATSCGGAPPPVVAPDASVRGTLLDVVPEGASIVVWGRPDVLWASPVTRQIVGALVPPGSLDELATRTGVDVRRATEAVVAEYPSGVLLLVRGPFVAAELVAEAEVRMGVVESRSDTPFVRRGGLFGTDHRELVAIGPDVLVVATDVEPLSALLACVTAMRRRPDASRECRPAIRRGPLRSAHARGPLVVYAPAHVDLPPGLGASLLLAEERELAVDASPSGSVVAVELDVRGEFPPHAEDNFRALWGSLARSELGAVIGLDARADGPRIQRTADGVRVATELPVDGLVRGLRTLFGGEIRAMLSDSNH